MTEYAGEHAACQMSIDKLRVDYRQGLAEARASHEANVRIANTVRLLLLPGIKRKTYRRDELQAIVDAADGVLV